MPVLGETNLLVPDPTFFVTLVLLTVLTVWPLMGAAMRQQWAWLLVIILTGPLGGVAWLAVGRSRARLLKSSA